MFAQDLGGRAQGDARETATEREGDFVDLGFIEKREHDVERGALIFRAVRVGTDGHHHAAFFRLAQQTEMNGAILRTLRFVVEKVLIEIARVHFDRHVALGARSEKTIFVGFEDVVGRPMTEFCRDVKMADDVPR